MEQGAILAMTRGQLLANDELETEETNPVALMELEVCQQPYELESGSFCCQDSVKTPAPGCTPLFQLCEPLKLRTQLSGARIYEITNVCCFKPLQKW